MDHFIGDRKLKKSRSMINISRKDVNEQIFAKLNNLEKDEIIELINNYLITPCAKNRFNQLISRYIDNKL